MPLWTQGQNEAGLGLTVREGQELLLSHSSAFHPWPTLPLGIATDVAEPRGTAHGTEHAQMSPKGERR